MGECTVGPLTETCTTAVPDHRFPPSPANYSLFVRYLWFTTVERVQKLTPVDLGPTPPSPQQRAGDRVLHIMRGVEWERNALSSQDVS